ncbi:MAG: glycosyltransferase family 39 protein [Anaerolineae bacterium]|nr:glycosyltransferase family 39 protein [Anaerolineae bacterium]
MSRPRATLLGERTAPALWGLAFVAAAFALRVWGLSFQSLWRDETDALFFATRPLARVLATFAIPGRNGPLYFLLLKGWIALAGQTEFALRFPAAAASTLALPLTWAVARRLGCARAGFWSLPLLACSPFLVWYGQDGKMYAVVLAAVLCSTWVFLRALEARRAAWWAAYGLVAGASLYLHLLTVLVVPVHACWFALEARARGARRAVWWGAVAFVAAALPVLAWGVPLFLSDYESGHPFYSLGAMARAMLFIFVGGVGGMPGRWALVPSLFLALTGSVLGLGERATRGAAVRVLIWLLLPLLTLAAISLRVPLFTERYLIWTAPAWYLLLGMGVERVAAAARGIGARALALACLGAVLATAVFPLWTQSHVPLKSDFRGAAAYVAAHREPGDLVLFQMPHVRRTFQYYFRQPYRWAEGPYTNYGQPPEEVARHLDGLTAGYRRVWLVLSEPEMWDRRGLTRRWLEEHGQVVARQSFARVEVICYHLGEPTPARTNPATR